MKKNLSRMGLPVGFLVLILLLLVPTPPDLSTAGHRMLAILVFSVIIWMTEAVAYPVSSGIIMSLMAFLLGTAPNMVNPSKMLGTSGALKMALGGFSSTALALVGAALLIAAAMMKTGLDKRIALVVLSKIGAKTHHVLAGVICVGFVLSFFVPSTTARVSCMVPIVMGIIAVFGVPRKSIDGFEGITFIPESLQDLNGVVAAGELTEPGVKLAVQLHKFLRIIGKIEHF